MNLEADNSFFDFVFAVLLHWGLFDMFILLGLFSNLGEMEG